MLPEFLRKGVQAMLYGQYHPNIDAKGRMFVPAKLREQMGDALVAAIVMDNCICLYSEQAWDEFLSDLAEQPMTESQDLLRQLTLMADSLEVDAQGRILLQKHMLAEVGLGKETLVIGAGRYVEIWNPETFAAEKGRMSRDEVRARLRAMGK